MLSYLRVENFGPVKKAEIEPSEAFTAITGETGAGKTLILGALDLLFEPKSKYLGNIKETINIEAQFFSNDNKELIIKKTINANSRSKTFVNNELYSAAKVLELKPELIEFSSQNSFQRLMKRPFQLSALDKFAKIDKSRYFEYKANCKELEAKLAGLPNDRQISEIVETLDQLNKAKLKDTLELEELAEKEETLSKAGQIRELSLNLIETFEEFYRRLSVSLKEATKLAFFESFIDRFDGFLQGAQDLKFDLLKALEEVSSDPESLEVVKERRRLLSDLLKLYKVKDLKELIDYKKKLEDSILEFSDIKSLKIELESNLAELQEKLAKQERLINEQRLKQKNALANQVNTWLKQLNLEGARFSVTEDFEFYFTSNSSIKPSPLSKIASGGELSRVMLALELVISNPGPSLIFDEIDAGIGGISAIEVGKALKRLSRTSQVIVITHLPQVAAFADAHYVVVKNNEENTSNARLLSGKNRQEELARMLAGLPESQTARKTASELLELASKTK
jgi:DNA repair protein RecN (Recombination protein N)